MVDGSGKIQAQGETVQKVLVDGKPFFDGDPNLALKNLPAEVVQNIQVFDKKSEQAEFTGFEDGNSVKTINVITRRGMQTGVFGKLNAGIGLDQDNKTDYQGSLSMPFDPLWQMLGYTVTNQEFYDGKTGPSNRKLFSYKDSIAHHLSLPESDQLTASARRIEANGVKNGLIFEQLQHIHQQIDYLHNTAVVTQFNEAVKHYNNGISLLNQFIEYRNKQFSPKKEEADIRRMVDTVAVELAMARKQIAAIEKPDAQTATSISQLSQSIDQATAGMNEQKAFVDKYFKTGKLFRKTLFYKYTWMGIPVH